MSLNKIILIAGSVIGLLSSAVSHADVIFKEEFSGATLDSAWNVSAHTRASYSLSANPGYARYQLGGGWQGASGWWGPTNYWSPTTTLSRGFEGENWVLDVKVNYNLNSHGPGYSTGVQGSALYLAFDAGNYVMLGRNVDWWYDQSSVNPLGYLNSGGAASVGSIQHHGNGRDPELVGGVDVGGWVSGEQYYRMVRSGSTISGFVSQDGVSYHNVFDADFGMGAKSGQSRFKRLVNFPGLV